MSITNMSPQAKFESIFVISAILLVAFVIACVTVYKLRVLSEKGQSIRAGIDPIRVTCGIDGVTMNNFSLCMKAAESRHSLDTK